MIRSDFIARIAGFGIFYRWHPAIALRYLPFVESIQRMKNVKNILEVGSDGLGVVPYLKRQVTGVDVSFRPPFHPLLKRVKASVAHLPFPNSSYDVVISVDMLEHLKKHDRKRAIMEILRVAKKRVFIGVPCGREAYASDVILHGDYKNKYGREFHFITEHIKTGLPEKTEIYNMIMQTSNQLHKNLQIKIYGNENLILHKILMEGWMTKNLLVDIFFRKILLFAIPILRIIDRSPYYRQLFFIDIKNENSN